MAITHYTAEPIFFFFASYPTPDIKYCFVKHQSIICVYCYSFDVQSSYCWFKLF